jgi:glutamyl-tRNA synthetase
MIKEFDKKVRAYALKNAVAYEGKAMMGPVISSLFHEGLKKTEVGKYSKKILGIISEVNRLSPEEQKKEFEKLEKNVSERPEREGLEELPDADKKKGIITRFRPAPSGFLHVGHIISNMPCSLYVKKYGGKFYVIIDDTDPRTAVIEAYKQIQKDCDWIFGNVHAYLIASERMEIYYDYAKKLIAKKAAYVCTCPPEKFKKFVEQEKNCPCRKNTEKKNLELWNKMLDKGKEGFKEEEAVLRFRSDMKNRNPAMRDFPLARICVHRHPVQKDKYRVWPLMNLAVAADDIDIGMTHIIRGKDHKDNAERQKMIYGVLGKKFPWTAFIGRIKFSDVVLSKRKLKAAIERGEFAGYDDARIPTIASLKKRGYNPGAFAKFIEQRGLTEVDKVISQRDFFKIIDNFNRE